MQTTVHNITAQPTFSKGCHRQLIFPQASAAIIIHQYRWSLSILLVFYCHAMIMRLRDMHGIKVYQCSVGFGQVLIITARIFGKPGILRARNVATSKP